MVGRALVANRWLAGSARGKRQRVRPLNLVVSWHSASMASNPKTYGEVESFVTMLLAACDDAGMNDTLAALFNGIH